jgi:uncharacterized membrane protein YbhN (UPF0104 family)
MIRAVFLTILNWSPTLSAGDLVVGIGTLFLAIFTYVLARATYALDDRNNKRENERHAREVRGAARLVHGELEISRQSMEAGLEVHRWERFWITPHGAWDSSGSTITQAVSEATASALIWAFSMIRAWTALLAQLHDEHGEPSVVQISETEIEILENVIGDVRRAADLIRPLAYPGTQT